MSKIHIFKAGGQWRFSFYWHMVLWQGNAESREKLCIALKTLLEREHVYGR